MKKNWRNWDWSGNIIGSLLIVTIIFSIIFLPVACYNSCKETEAAELNRRIYLNGKHTSWHYGDTLTVNSDKYIKVYDSSNAGPLGPFFTKHGGCHPYMIKVK